MRQLHQTVIGLLLIFAGITAFVLSGGIAYPIPAFGLSIAFIGFFILYLVLK